MRTLLIGLLLVVLGLVILDTYRPGRGTGPGATIAPAAQGPLAEGGNGFPYCPPCQS